MFNADLRKRAPFLGVVLALICGILLYSSEYRFLSGRLLILALGAWIAGLIYHVNYRRHAGKAGNAFFKWLMLFLFGIAGWHWAMLHDQHHLARELVSGQKEMVRFLVNDAPQKRGQRVRVDGIITHIWKQGNWEESKIGCRVYFSGVQPEYGQVWLLNTAFTLPDSAYIPFMFDVRAYLQYKGIYLNGSVRHHQAARISEGEGTWYATLAHKIRHKSLEAMNSMEKDMLSAGVVKALLLGYRNDLDDSVTTSFSKTGVIHVLAVSGMHVGIIYLVLSFLLFPLRRLKRGNLIVSIGIILSLWLFALITGLSPSVNRAALMFSVVQIGSVLGRKTHILNSLAFSAVIMILFNPYVIYQAGFQLSFAAVLGIVIAADSLIRLLKPSDWLLQKIVDLSSVSIGAQLATFPLGIFYFHQLSLVFLLANMLVLPFIPLILYLGLLSIALWLIGAADAASFVFQWAENYVTFIRYGVQWMEAFSWSSLNGVYLSKPQVLLLYVMMLGAFWNPERKGLIRLQRGFMLFILLVYGVLESNQRANQERFKGKWTFDYNGQPVMIVSESREVMAFLPEEMLIKDPQVSFQTAGLNAFLKCRTQAYPLSVLSDTGPE